MAAIPLQPVQREGARRGRLRWPSLGKSPLARREAKWGLLFISPWIIGFLAVHADPDASPRSGSASRTSASRRGNPSGSSDSTTTWRCSRIARSGSRSGITLSFAALNLPIAIIVPFVVALVLSSPYLRGEGVFRTMFFLPYVIPFVAGVLDLAGDAQHRDRLDRRVPAVRRHRARRTSFRTRRWSIRAWCSSACGPSAPGSSSTSRACVPSRPSSTTRSHIDGGGWWPPLRHVTLPLMSPVIFYVLVLGIVEVLQYFLVPLVLYNGSGEPGGSTLFFNLLLYKTAFGYQNFAYGSALAWLLFAVTLGITLLVFRSARYWVYAAGIGRPMDVAASGPDVRGRCRPRERRIKPKDATRSFVVDLHRRRGAGGVPVAAHAPS